MSTISVNRKKDTAEAPGIESLCKSVYAAVQGTHASRLIYILVALNLVLLYCRPQHQIPLIGTLKLPMLMGLVLALVWLKNIRTMYWGIESKLMLIVLIICAGWIPIARNNFWAFHTTLDLTIQFFCYMFPIIALMSHGKGLRTVLHTCIFMGVYIGLYAATHNGMGPGGFVQDENDTCLVLLLFLSLTLGIALHEQQHGKRLILLAAALVILGGIVSTMSRGGFIGLIVMLGYLFTKVRRKLIAAFVLGVLGLVALFFIPESYWMEMSTISTQESTAQERLHMWSVALRIWFNVEHFTFGVGPQNTQWWIRDYESVIAASQYGRSVAGRAVHSMYVQLIVDLGVVGMSLFLFLAFKAFRSNQAVRREADTLHDEIMPTYLRLQSLHSEEGVERLPTDDDSKHQNVVLSEKQLEEVHLLEQTLRVAAAETHFLHALGVALNAAWLGVLAAGTFISIFYYPPIWTLAAVSATLFLYKHHLLSAVKPIIAQAQPQDKTPHSGTERGRDPI